MPGRLRRPEGASLQGLRPGGSAGTLAGRGGEGRWSGRAVRQRLATTAGKGAGAPGNGNDPPPFGRGRSRSYGPATANEGGPPLPKSVPTGSTESVCNEDPTQPLSNFTRRRRTTRREFLKKTAVAAGAALAMPYVIRGRRARRRASSASPSSAPAAWAATPSTWPSASAASRCATSMTASWPRRSRGSPTAPRRARPEGLRDYRELSRSAPTTSTSCSISDPRPHTTRRPRSAPSTWASTCSSRSRWPTTSASAQELAQAARRRAS